MSYQQGFMGSLIFRTQEDLERGLVSAETILREEGLSFDLRSYIRRLEAQEGQDDSDYWQFTIDKQMYAPALVFDDLVRSLRKLSFFSPSGEVNCWIIVDGATNVEIVTGQLDESKRKE